MRARLLISLVAAVVAALALGAAFASVSGFSPQVPAGVLFSDYFTDAKGSAENWTFFNREGRIADGRLWIDGSYMANSDGRDGWALTHIGDRTWRNYVVEVFYDNTNLGGSPDHHMGMINFRVASETGNVRTTMYGIDIWDPGDVYEGGSCAAYGTVMPNGWVQLRKYVDGAVSWPAEACSSNTTHGTNAVQVVVLGSHIEVIINGQTVMRYRDPAPIKFGGVGVGQIWETNGWYDNIVVTRLLDVSWFQ